ncbi:MAG: DUF4358 domain-containing protein [Lachnospiraceae bacterium]|nr:DUF4358 domain-containing protein [Lachnospiraceae bacterium]
MKKYFGLVLATVCVIGLVGVAACNKKDDNGTTTTTTAATTEAPTTEAPKKDVSLTEVHEAVKAAYGEMYFPNMPLDAELLANLKTIPADLYSEFIAEMPMISANADEFMAFKAAEGKADDLEKALNAYKDYLINESFQYPANKVRVQASEVIRHGDYMFFVLLGGGISMETEALGEEAMLAEAKAQVKVGVDAINAFFN